ncbi:MAG: bile acid:sodium symporter [Gammaproteobacteria bacterium]|nr:bile acid:sodium symporter [Gammaproteobacteria bacterium]NNC56210.1 bile acid:sodium symporter family protein [Woeseiaceae bacterium]NNL49770.1 bile acid:sodium symporter family protein [Woeseiaceae bacterium]
MDVAELDSLRIVLDPIGQTGVALALMLVMFSVALGLRVDDFRFLLDKPLLFLGGVVAQVLVLPLVTFALILVLVPPASVALGMIVVACCPGGAVSNLMTYLSRGNVAVSVALTATSSMLAAILTPASILFWSHAYEPTSTLLKTLDVSPYLFLAQTTFLLAVPLVLGMTVAAKAPDVAERIRRRATLLGSSVLVGVIIYGILYFFDILVPVLSVIGIVVVIHNAVAFATGAAAGMLLSRLSATRRALTFEIGIQNSGLALVILLSQLKGLGGAAAMAAVWGVWDLIAGGLIVGLFRILDNKRQLHWQTGQK